MSASWSTPLARLTGIPDQTIANPTADDVINTRRRLQDFDDLAANGWAFDYASNYGPAGTYVGDQQKAVLSSQRAGLQALLGVQVSAIDDPAGYLKRTEVPALLDSAGIAAKSSQVAPALGFGAAILAAAFFLGRK